jgi:hypothetical protein
MERTNQSVETGSPVNKVNDLRGFRARRLLQIIMCIQEPDELVQGLPVEQG